MKQAPRALFQKLSSTLLKLGFVSSKADSSMFLSFIPTRTTTLLVYVDDIVITGNNSTYLGVLISLLNNKFVLKNLGSLNYFLGMEVKRTRAGLHLSQHRYIVIYLKE